MRTLMIALALAALAACAKPTTTAAPAAAAKSLKGTVLETKNAGGVTYVRLKSGADERWIVTPQTEVKAGTPVTVQLSDIAFGRIDEAAVKVEKAEGTDAKTVAEVWASKSALKDRQVVVRAKVVKFLPSIMGKNWMHVRDGSGSHAKGDDDLAVITDDPAKVGSVVTLTGTVRLDKDFGAGYQYPVIIEGAKLK